MNTAPADVINIINSFLPRYYCEWRLVNRFWNDSISPDYFIIKTYEDSLNVARNVAIVLSRIICTPAANSFNTMHRNAVRIPMNCIPTRFCFTKNIMSQNLTALRILYLPSCDLTVPEMNMLPPQLEELSIHNIIHVMPNKKPARIKYTGNIKRLSVVELSYYHVDDIPCVNMLRITNDKSNDRLAHINHAPPVKKIANIIVCNYDTAIRVSASHNDHLFYRRFILPFSYFGIIDKSGKSKQDVFRGIPIILKTPEQMRR